VLSRHQKDYTKEESNMGYSFAQVRYNQYNSSMSNTTAAAMKSGAAFANLSPIV